MNGCEIERTQNFCRENTGLYNEQWMDVKRNAHRTFVEKIQEITMSNDWVCTGINIDKEIRIQADLY